MKKFISLALILATAFTLAACDNNKDGNSSGTTGGATSGESTTAVSTTASQTTAEVSKQPDNSSETGQAMNTLIKWMMNGKFSYDYTMNMISDGEENTTSKGSMAMDGEKMAMTSEMTMNGQVIKSRMIKKDDKFYTINDETKTIMEVPFSAETMQGLMEDYSDITMTGSGTGEIDGKTLPYEEYSENTTGAKIKYFLDGDTVYGYETGLEGFKSVMIIKNASDKVPDGVFDLPEGYTNPMNSGGR